MSSGVSSKTSNLVGVCDISITSAVCERVMPFAKVDIYLRSPAGIYIHNPLVIYLMLTGCGSFYQWD